MSNYIGDYEPGQTIAFNFNTRQADGTPTDQVQRIGGGAATWQAVRIEDGAVLDISSFVTLNAPTPPGGPARVGFHKVLIDPDVNPTVEAFFTEEQSYAFIANSVEVFDGTVFRSVAGTIIREFSIVYRTAGFVLTRSHKIFDGVISSVTDAKTFRIQGEGINTTNVDFYVGEQLVMQSPSVNQGLTRIVVNYDNITQEIIVDEPFPVVPNVDDPFDMLHGQDLPLFTANILFRAGGAATTDAISVEWHRNGSVISPLATLIAEIPTTTLKVFSIKYPSNVATTALIETITDLPIDPLTGTFQYVLTANKSTVGEGLRMEASAIITSTQRAISFSRTMFVSP